MLKRLKETNYIKCELMQEFFANYAMTFACMLDTLHYVPDKARSYYVKCVLKDMKKQRKVVNYVAKYKVREFINGSTSLADNNDKKREDCSCKDLIAKQG